MLFPKPDCFFHPVFKDHQEPLTPILYSSESHYTFSKTLLFLQKAHQAIVSVVNISQFPRKFFSYKWNSHSYISVCLFSAQYTFPHLYVVLLSSSLCKTLIVSQHPPWTLYSYIGKYHLSKTPTLFPLFPDFLLTRVYAFQCVLACVFALLFYFQ